MVLITCAWRSSKWKKRDYFGMVILVISIIALNRLESHFQVR